MRVAQRLDQPIEMRAAARFAFRRAASIAAPICSQAASIARIVAATARTSEPSMPIEAAMSNSFAFGGLNAVLAAKKFS